MTAVVVCRQQQQQQYTNRVRLSTSLGAICPCQDEVASDESFRSGSLDDGEHVRAVGGGAIERRLTTLRASLETPKVCAIMST